MEQMPPMPQIDLNHPFVVVTLALIAVWGLQIILSFVRWMVERRNGKNGGGPGPPCPFGVATSKDMKDHYKEMSEFIGAIKTEMHQANEERRDLAAALRGLTQTLIQRGER